MKMCNMIVWAKQDKYYVSKLVLTNFQQEFYKSSVNHILNVNISFLKWMHLGSLNSVFSDG